MDVCLTLRADPFRGTATAKSDTGRKQLVQFPPPTTSKGSSYLCGKIDLAADVAGGALRRVPNLDIASLHHHDCKALSQLTLPFLEHCVFPSVFEVKIPLPLVIGIPKIFLQR